MWLKVGICSLVITIIAGQLIDEDLSTELPPVLPEGPTVTITQGTVVGSRSSDGNIAEFYGIPYADSTSGSNRFKAPRPAPSFQDTFVANRKDIKCVRALGNGYEGTEDCLVANVFTTTLDNSRQLPVMVWVKGKEFDKVYEFEPSFENFVERDVVVVSLNYRESVLGFLCLGTETAPGNAGLKDILAGLRWVHENIAQFGGNPNDVTLVGHGSGAAAVDLITLSPMAQGLVHRAISQSGNAFSPWAVSRDNTHYAVLVAKALGHEITNIEDLSQIFTRISVPALMGVINDLDLIDNSLAFSPCVEKNDLPGIDPLLIKSPVEIINAREQLQIPLIMGYVDNEGTIRSEEVYEDNWLQRMDESFSDFLQPDLKFETAAERAEVALSIRNRYFQAEPITMANVDKYISYHGDTMILVSSLREVRLRARTQTAPVYLYQFSYKGSLGQPFVGPLEVTGAAHSEELAYLFCDAEEDEVNQEKDLQISDVLVERWTNFAKSESPQSETSTVFWRPYTTANSFFLRILDNEETQGQSVFDVQLQNPHPDTVAFWDDIYEKYFLDAESTWDFEDRNEEDDDDEDNSEEDNGGEDNGGEDNGGEDNGGEDNGGEDNGGDGDGEGDGSGEDDDNSAVTAIGYTFTIITLFTILSHLHSSVILS